MNASKTMLVTGASESSPEAVMMQFQQSMLQMTQAILLTQQQVMLCYLQNMRVASATTSLLDQSLYVAPYQVTADRKPQFSASQSHLSIVAPSGNHYDSPTIASSLEPSLLQKVELESNSLDESMVHDTDEVQLELDNDGLITALMDLISERTGYPTDMLDPDLDLESDLGIDSIKRIEILNNFQKILPEAKRAQFDEGSLEELAGARTLNELIDWIKRPATTAADTN